MLKSNEIKIVCNLNELISSNNQSSELTNTKKYNYLKKLFEQTYKITNSSYFELCLKGDKKTLDNDYFKITKFGELVYKTDNIDICNFLNKTISELEKITDIKKTNPVRSLGLSEKTHSISADSSVVMSRDIDKGFKNEAFNTIFISKNNIPKNVHNKLIIVENYKVFSFEDIQSFLDRFNIPKDDYEMIFGAGNAISSNIINMYLKQYSKIYYFGDYDSNGYKIYLNLKEKLKNITFVLPPREITQKIQEEIIIHRKYDTNKNKYKHMTSPLRDIFDQAGSIFEMKQEVFLF